MEDAKIGLDKIRIRAAERAFGNARSDWALSYWNGVRKNLRRNIQVQALFSQVGGNEHVSSLSKAAVWHH